jgi:hypothetical protein
MSRQELKNKVRSKNCAYSHKHEKWQQKWKKRCLNRTLNRKMTFSKPKQLIINQVNLKMKTKWNFQR